MSNFAANATPPRTLSRDEQRKILTVTGEHRDGFRDHVILCLALAAGMREHEIAALNVQDVIAYNHDLDGSHMPTAGEQGQYIRTRVLLSRFKGSGRAGGRQQEVILSDNLRAKLRKYLDTIRGRPLVEPLFLSQKRNRISTRQIRHMFALWQRRAGLERRFRFHDLRHTYCTSVYRESGRDVAQVQRLARHRRVQTSMRYVHPTEEEILSTVGKLP